MVDGNDAFTTTRRGAIKTGALGLGGLTGAIALGSSESATAATLPTMDTVAALAGVTSGAFFLQLDGIPGDSVDAGHPGWIPVNDWSTGATNSAVLTSSGWSSSKPRIETVSLTAQGGSQSPRLFLSTVSGRRSARALLQGVTRGDSPRTYLEVELRDVAVASYDVKAGEDGSIVDDFALAYGSIRFTIYLQSATGGAGETISATWNVRTGTGSST